MSKKVMVLVHPDFAPPRGKTESHILAALRKLGHIVEVVGAQASLSAIEKAVTSFRPHIVFNMLEEFIGEGIFDFHPVSYLESKGIPYTGCNPRGLVISRNKYLTTLLAQGLSIRTPKTKLIGESSNTRLKYPQFVKFNREHASLGIQNNNRVTNQAQLSATVRRMRAMMPSEILLQEFIAGLDVSVSVLGNSRAEVFPPWSLRLGSQNSFATERIKFSSMARHRRGVRAIKYGGEAVAEISANSKTLFKAMELSGYARFDYRINSLGQAYLIDVNANPNLANDEDFAFSAKAGGCQYIELIDKILRLGLNYRPQT